MTSARRRTRTLALVGATGVLGLGAAACGAGGDGGRTGASPQQTVTVTTTPGTASPSSTAAPTVTSDVAGRAFDVGTVRSVTTVGRVLVVELDRWTLPGTTDSTLAVKGVRLAPHRGPRFTNQNSTKTYTAPVADGARVVVNTCVPAAGGELGLRSAPEAATTWLEKPDRSAVVVVSYDKAGAITKMETDPRCPG